MKKLLMAIAGILALGAFNVAVAAPAGQEQASTPTANLKIGVVDVRQIIQKSAQMAAVNSELEKEFKPREQKIVSAGKELQSEVDKLNRDSAIMTDSERTKLRDKIVSDRASNQAAITAFQQELNTAQNQAMQKLLNQVAQVVNKLAKEGNYDLILQGENVPYVSSRLNITEQVAQALAKSSR